MLIVVLAAISMINSGSRSAPTLAQEPTLTPQFTALPTRTPIRPLFEVQPFTTVFFDLPQQPFTFLQLNMGSFAVAKNGKVYLPDGQTKVLVFGADLKYESSFSAAAPVHLATTPAHDQLRLGSAYPASVTAYSLDGEAVSVLWQTPHAFLDALAVAPDGSMIALTRSEFKPYPVDVFRLDPQGNIVFQRVFAERSTSKDLISGVTFNADGSYYVALTGFGRPYDRTSIAYFSAAGDLITREKSPYLYPYWFGPGMTPLRLSNGQFVLFGISGLGWWNSDSRVLAFKLPVDATGYFPTLQGVRQARAALGPDGTTIYYAQFIRDDLMILGYTSLRRTR